MKYRCLTDDELKELEPEFKQFLIVNHVHAEEWEELNKKGDDRVMELVELFSDLVMERALSNIKYLEHITSSDIKAFKCGEKEMILVGINATSDTVDLTKDKLSELNGKLDIFRTSKPYYKERAEEVFDLLESGCSIIDEERFASFEKAHVLSTKNQIN